MAGIFSKLTRRGKNDENKQPPVRVGGVGKETTYEAAERTQLPLNGYMTRMMAQELPILDSTSRQRVRDILRQYAADGGAEITTIDELPCEIRDIMDLH